MIRTLIVAAGLAAAGTANAAFVGGVIRVDAAASAAASADIGFAVTVTRMYMAFDEADDRLISIGNAEFHGVADLYQDVAFGADNVGGINPAFFAFPGVNSEYDSFTGIGGPNFTGSGFGDANDPSFTWASDGVASGGWFTTPNGAGVFPGSGPAGPSGFFEVFAGQFTLVGDFTGGGARGANDVGNGFINTNNGGGDLFQGLFSNGMGLDVNWVEAAGDNLSVNRVEVGVPAPGAAALFGLAGLTASRRRRG